MLRKFYNLFAIAFLSMSIINMAGGITVKQCLCTGKLSIVNSFNRSLFSSSEHKTPCQDQQGVKELSASPCMKIHMVSLDDFTSSPSQIHDFAPLISLFLMSLNRLFAVSPQQITGSKSLIMSEKSRYLPDNS